VLAQSTMAQTYRATVDRAPPASDRNSKALGALIGTLTPAKRQSALESRPHRLRISRCGDEMHADDRSMKPAHTMLVCSAMMVLAQGL
jgi:hypothetical protein